MVNTTFRLVYVDASRVGMMAASFLQESVNRGFSRIGVASAVNNPQSLVVIVLGRCLASMEGISKRQGLGRTVRLQTADQELQGIFSGISSEGFLVLEVEGKSQQFVSGHLLI